MVSAPIEQEHLAGDASHLWIMREGIHHRLRPVWVNGGIIVQQANVFPSCAFHPCIACPRKAIDCLGEAEPMITSLKSGLGELA
jgi:hypothetical protein